MKRVISLSVFLFAIAILLTSTVPVQGQEEETESPISAGADLYSRYIFRGLDIGGGSPNIQPYIEAGFGHFAFGAWGSYRTNFPGALEMDLYLNYTVMDIVTVGVIDYFLPNDFGEYDYFDYSTDSAGSGGHIFEAYATFNGLEDIPFTALLGVNLYGDSDNSIYFELGYSLSILDIFIGAGNGQYLTGDGDFGIVNLGISTSKEIKITDKLSLPLSVSLITNPEAKRIHLVVGISL